MNTSSKQTIGPARAAARTPDAASRALSADETRALILRSRSISESEARLAAAIDADEPGGPAQPQEDAFDPPRRASAASPAGKR